MPSGLPDQGVIHTYITGSGFLQHMVRIIMGTLMQVGEGKVSADQIPVILAACDRGAAGPTAVSKGLALWSVEYDESVMTEEGNTIFRKIVSLKVKNHLHSSGLCCNIKVVFS